METFYLFLRLHHPFFVVFFSVLLLTSAFLGVGLYRGSPGMEPAVRRLLALVPACVLVLAFLFFHKIASSPAAPYNWTRLGRTFLLAFGKKLYFPPNGPAVIAMYGPVSALSFWPATRMHSLTSMMEAASFINLSLFLFPALWACLGRGVFAGRSRLHGLSGFLVFSFFLFFTSSLRDAAFNVHADGPALCFSALACLALVATEVGGARSLALSAFFTVMAFWSKQVTAPLFAACLVYTGLRKGRPAFWRHLFWLVLFGAAVSGFFVAVFGFRELWFNLVTIPARQPLRAEQGFPALPFAVYKLVHESFFVILLTLVVFRKSSFRDGRPWTLFLLAAAVLTPLAILGKMKVGGANNTLSYAAYFLLLAAVLRLAEWNVQGSLRRFTNVLLAIFTVVQAALVFYKFTVPPVETNFAQTAFDYAVKHPGEAYFPRLTLVHLLTEGKVYHESPALIDRKWAGLPVAGDQLRAFMPPHAKRIAFHEASGDDRLWLDLPEFSTEKGRDPELPGFVVYPRATG